MIVLSNYFIYKEIQKKRINFSNLNLIEEVKNLKCTCELEIDGEKWENIVEIIGDGMMILQDDKVLSYNPKLTEMLKIDHASSEKEEEVYSFL
jgi:hypothetical protein